MKRGDKVLHKTRGQGVIVGQWKSWFSCRACGDETLPPKLTPCPWCRTLVSTTVVKAQAPRRYTCNVCENMLLSEACYSFCPSCRSMQHVVSVNASHIFVVRFFSEPLPVPVWEGWLKTPEKSAQAAA